MADGTKWMNDCSTCNGKGSEHLEDKCCLSCRNFTNVDKQATILTLDKVMRVFSEKATIWSKLKLRDAGLNSATSTLVEESKNYEEARSQVDEKDAAHDAVRSEQAFKELQKAIRAFEAAKQAKAKAQARVDEEQEQALQDVQQIARWLIDNAGLGKSSDSVELARFFYVWIGSTLQYGLKVMNSGANRQPINTLLTRVEVCAGFSRLFNAMFDAVVPDIGGRKLKSLYISGWAKTKPEDTEPKNDLLHAWNAFPYLKDGKEAWKLIDITWGSGNAAIRADSTPIDPTWFTRPNDEFLRDHLPRDAVQQFQSVGGPVSNELFWGNKRTLPTFMLPARYLNKPEIFPAKRVIERAFQRFEYRPVCKHLRQDAMPQFGLFPYREEPGKVFQFQVDQCELLVKESNEPLRWSAAVDLVKKYAGCNRVILACFYHAPVTKPAASEPGASLGPEPPLVPTPYAADIKQLRVLWNADTFQVSGAAEWIVTG